MPLSDIWLNWIESFIYINLQLTYNWAAFSLFAVSLTARGFFGYAKKKIFQLSFSKYINSGQKRMKFKISWRSIYWEKGDVIFWLKALHRELKNIWAKQQSTSFILGCRISFIAKILLSKTRLVPGLADLTLFFFFFSKSSRNGVKKNILQEATVLSVIIRVIGRGTFDLLWQRPRTFCCRDLCQSVTGWFWNEMIRLWDVLKP